MLSAAKHLASSIRSRPFIGFSVVALVAAIGVVALVVARGASPSSAPPTPAVRLPSPSPAAAATPIPTPALRPSGGSLPEPPALASPVLGGGAPLATVAIPRADATQARAGGGTPVQKEGFIQDGASAPGGAQGEGGAGPAGAPGAAGQPGAALGSAGHPGAAPGGSGGAPGAQGSGALPPPSTPRPLNPALNPIPTPIPALPIIEVAPRPTQPAAGPALLIPTVGLPATPTAASKPAISTSAPIEFPGVPKAGGAGGGAPSGGAGGAGGGAPSGGAGGAGGSGGGSEP